MNNISSSPKKYLDDLLLHYQETILELKKDKIVLQKIIDNLLNNKNNKTESHKESDEIVLSSDIDKTLSDELIQIFQIADEYNNKYPKEFIQFPSVAYFKTKGINRYAIQKQSGLKILKDKYIESRKNEHLLN